MEKKFKLPPGGYISPVLQAMEDEINTLYELLEKLGKQKMQRLQDGVNQLNCWCIYCGYPTHLSGCHYKGPTGL